MIDQTTLDCKMYLCINRIARADRAGDAAARGNKKSRLESWNLSGRQAGKRPKLDTASISGFWEKCKYEIF